jgi:phosphatidylglycerophosphatase A
MKMPVWRLFLTSPVLWLATGFGAGLSPWAPGTVGTALGILIFLGLLRVSLPAYLLLVVLGFALGTWLCSVAARLLDEHDHPAVVWDEVIGYLLTMLPVIWLHRPATALVLLAGFVLFRVFDILKPWPIS